MSKPKAEYYFYKDNDVKHSFINPYTFVPVEEGNQNQPNDQSAHLEDDRFLTGVLTCHLHIKTPVIIPDPELREPDPEVKDHYHYPFMKINERYIIPGSSIRGPVRSVYETLTDSCFSTMKDSQMITARTKKPFNPGILFLRDGNYILVAADRYMITMNPKDLKPSKSRNSVSVKKKYSRKELLEYGYGSFLRFIGKTSITKKNIKVHYVDEILGEADLTGISLQEQYSGEKIGFLFIGEKIGNKHYESIFVCKDDIPCEEGDHSAYYNKFTAEDVKTAYTNLKNTVDVYQDEAVNRNLGSDHSGYRHVDFESFENGTVPALPVWYNGEGSLLHFSIANIGRFTYNRPLNDIVPERNRPCTDIDHACKACSLFGMIKRGGGDFSDDGIGGAGSRIRFSDAKMIYPSEETEIEKVKWEQTLSELSSPKPSYLPFYINSYSFTNGYDDPAVSIKGRKYYWHYHPAIEAKSGTGAKKSQRNATMQMIKAPAIFEFSVFFDGISKAQLRELECVLYLGENRDDGNMCYKIGHGKPLGFGSIKITVDSCAIREFDNGNYSFRKTEIKEFSEEKVEEVFDVWPGGLRDILDFSFTDHLENIAGYGIHYPYVENGTQATKEYVNDKYQNALAAHQWFGKNYSFGRGTSRYNLIIPAGCEGGSPANILPRIALPALKLTDIKDENGSVLINAEGDKVPAVMSDRQHQDKSIDMPIRKSQVINVIISWVSIDSRDYQKNFGRFQHPSPGGSIKNLPLTAKVGDSVVVKVTNPLTKDGKVFTEYLGHLNK